MKNSMGTPQPQKQKDRQVNRAKKIEQLKRQIKIAQSHLRNMVAISK